MSAALPPGFVDLERFVPEWTLPDVRARMAKRQASAIEDLRAFYHAMLPRGEAALAYLRGYPLGAVSPDAENLLKLMLMLAEVAPAVEWYNDPRVYDGFPVERLTFLRMIPDSAAQIAGGGHG